MQPLSHAALVQLIRPVLSGRNLKLEEISIRAGIGLNALASMMAGQAYFTEKALAGLGEMLQIDYSMVYARYALWRFSEAQRELRKPRLPTLKRPSGYNELNALVRQIVAQGANLPNDALIAQIMSATQVMEPIAHTALIIAKNELKTGDYDEAGRAEHPTYGTAF